MALGANVPGLWGDPYTTLQKAQQVLVFCGFRDIRVSPLYRTKGHGQIRQPPYLNLVLAAQCALSPRQIIDIAKQIERRSGRRLVGRNGPRPLDIDLIDYAGRIVNWPPARARAKLVLPHPLMAERPFVLAPLEDIAPLWRHPVFGLTARQLLRRQGGRHEIMLRREICRVDLNALTCNSQQKSAGAEI